MTGSSFFYDDCTSRKFWSYTLRGKKQIVRHGRIGTQGRENTKTFPIASVAMAATEKLVSQKTAKGYFPIDPGKLKIKRPKGKRAATKTQVAKLERQVGRTLPEEYRHFLLTQNGGEPIPNRMRIPVLSPNDSLPINFIYGLYAKTEPFKSLLFAVKEILPQLPEGHLPVAGTFNLYYFSLSLDLRRACAPQPRRAIDGRSDHARCIGTKAGQPSMLDCV